MPSCHLCEKHEQNKECRKAFDVIVQYSSGGFFQDPPRAGGEWIRVGRIKF